MITLDPRPRPDTPRPLKGCIAGSVAEKLFPPRAHGQCLCIGSHYYVETDLGELIDSANDPWSAIVLGAQALDRSKRFVSVCTPAGDVIHVFDRAMISSSAIRRIKKAERETFGTESR